MFWQDKAGNYFPTFSGGIGIADRMAHTNLPQICGRLIPASGLNFVKFDGLSCPEARGYGGFRIPGSPKNPTESFRCWLHQGGCMEIAVGVFLAADPADFHRSLTPPAFPAMIHEGSRPWNSTNSPSSTAS
jgi:hypothetical protein